MVVYFFSYMEDIVKQIILNINYAYHNVYWEMFLSICDPQEAPLFF